MQAFSPDLLSRSLLAAELLGLAVSRLFPQTLLIGGGVHTLGFCYDFIFKQPLMESLFSLIEVEVKAIIKERIPIRWLSMMRENAQTLFDYHQQPLLADRIGEEPSNIVELIQIQNFYGICAEQPFSFTEEAGQIKLLHYSEKQKEGLEKGERLIRLIGTSQATTKDLKVFLKNFDLLLKRKDHRKLGPQLNFFYYSDETPLGMFWFPKGMKLRQILKRSLEERFSEQALFVSTPLVQSSAVFSKKEKALSPFIFEEHSYQLRDSLLSAHIELLKKKILSGATVPLRIIEEGSIYHPVLESCRWGLLANCHQEVIQRTVVCLKEQFVAELISSLHFIEEIIKIFGFEARWVYLPVLAKGRRNELQQVIEEYSFFYPCFSELEEQEKGAFPRLELRVQDALGREWPLSVLEVRGLQVSLSKEEMSFVLISQQVLSSLERLIGLLIEKDEGDLPLWLAPEQVRLLVIGESSLPEAEKILRLMREKKLRVGLDKGSSKLNERIYEAEKERIPYLVFLGEEELKKGKIRFRKTGKGFSAHQGQWIDLGQFIEKIEQESLPL